MSFMFCTVSATGGAFLAILNNLLEKKQKQNKTSKMKLVRKFLEKEGKEKKKGNLIITDGNDHRREER